MFTVSSVVYSNICYLHSVSYSDSIIYSAFHCIQYFLLPYLQYPTSYIIHSIFCYLQYLPLFRVPSAVYSIFCYFRAFCYLQFILLLQYFL